LLQDRVRRNYGSSPGDLFTPVKTNHDRRQTKNADSATITVENPLGNVHRSCTRAFF